MNSKRVKDGITGALIALFIVFLVYSLKGPDYRNVFEHLAMNDIKQNSLLVKMYYDDYNKWPANLGTLYKEHKLNIPKFKLPGKYNMWETDWLYFPAQFPTKKIDDNQIMLATPTHWNKDKKFPDKGCESFRVVAYYNGKVKKISEKEYQKQIKAMTNAKPQNNTVLKP